MLNRFHVSLLTLIMLSACSLAPSQRQAADRLELDVPSASTSAAVAVGDITLRAPSWLETPQMGYRLRYSHSTKRDTYTLTRWVAPPSELVLQALKRGLPQGADGRGCRLRVELDEFVQDFQSAQNSSARIEARVRLLPVRGEGGVSRRFEVVVPAGFADAAGGVEALSRATQKWIEDLRVWLAAQPDAIKSSCKG